MLTHASCTACVDHDAIELPTTTVGTSCLYLRRFACLHDPDMTDEGDAVLHMAGTEVVFGWSVPIPTLEVERSFSDTPPPHEAAETPFATLAPKGAHIITVILDHTSTTYLLVRDNHALRVYRARPEYQVSGLLGPNSVVFAFAYLDCAGTAKLALFDCSRICGQEVGQRKPIERHVMLHELWNNMHHKASLDADVAFRDAYKKICIHWSGEENSCVGINLHDVPFTTEGVFRIPPRVPTTGHVLCVLWRPDMITAHA